jgi:predicted nucleic acid-binding protein
VILVDSSVWIDYFNGAASAHTDILDEKLGEEPVGIGDLMLTEVLQGFRTDSDFQKAKSLLLNIPVFELIGADRAIKAAENYRTLRVKGITVRKTIDTWIATFCIQQRFPLLYTDRDFDPFVQHLGLRTVVAT